MPRNCPVKNCVRNQVDLPAGGYFSDRAAVEVWLPSAVYPALKPKPDMPTPKCEIWV